MSDDELTGPATQITRAERDNLVKIVRGRARLASRQVEAHKAQLLADFEAQLATRYDSRHELWADITERAAKAVADADAQVAELCRERGIPASFRPSLEMRWYGRGENADRERRGELRKVATTQLDASAHAAKLEIERSSLDLQTQLMAGALATAESQAFLAAMPTVEQLMPRLALAELESAVPTGRA